MTYLAMIYAIGAAFVILSAGGVLGWAVGHGSQGFDEEEVKVAIVVAIVWPGVLAFAIAFCALWLGGRLAQQRNDADGEPPGIQFDPWPRPPPPGTRVRIPVPKDNSDG